MFPESISRLTIAGCATFTRPSGNRRCAADIEELGTDITKVMADLRQQQEMDSGGLEALRDRERECAQQTADLKGMRGWGPTTLDGPLHGCRIPNTPFAHPMPSDSLKEKEARLHYLQGRLNAQQSEREAMARLLAYLRGVA